MTNENPRRRRAVTAADVAKAVGVATSTVSRALTQPGRVSPEMRARVLEAATELGYRPNLQARSLSSGTMQSLALLVPDIGNPSFFDLIRGAQAQAKARGYHQILADTEGSAEVEYSLIEDLPAAVDGLILASSRLSDEQLAEASAKTPLVAMNRDVPDVPSLIIDSRTGTVQAVEHLASLGHRSVAYLAGPASSWSSKQRWQAVQTSARRLGMAAYHLGPFSPTRQTGAAAADAALNQGVTACVCFNDLLAIGALKRLAERGINVPGEMSVVGCDDIFGADFCQPPLTTLVTPSEQAGRVVVDMLLSRLKPFGASIPRPRSREVLVTSLRIRQSTGPAPSSR
ncbi:MAG: LacI family DNA-binding transcriptional regulator [Propionibacteriaceae bacterium]|nr:LacI family DNA-binding transcriptional regulator [Propionibacteriaceae bacterium]